MVQSHTGITEKEPCMEAESDYVVGVDIGATNLRIALADASGAILEKYSTSTAETRDPGLVVNLIREGVDRMLTQRSMPRAALRAIAAGAPGITDVDAGVVIATSYLLGWRDVPLRDLLESAFGVPTAVDNDVNLAALGESWAGTGQGVRDFVFLAIGTGIGAGIVLNNHLFHGMGWTAGEIGYMLVPGAPDEPTEQDAPGALENLAGGEGIRNQWLRAWNPAKTALPRDLTATGIFDAATRDGDPLAQTILQQTARTLAYAIYNMSLVLSCPLFVLGGSVGLHPALCEAAWAILHQRKARALPEIKRSMLGPDAQLFGATRLALSLDQKAGVPTAR